MWIASLWATIVQLKRAQTRTVLKAIFQTYSGTIIKCALYESGKLKISLDSIFKNRSVQKFDICWDDFLQKLRAIRNSN